MIVHFFNKLHKIGKDTLTKYLLLSYFFVSVTVIFFSCRDFDSYIEREAMRMKSTAYEIEASFTNTLDYTESVLNYINRKIAISGGNKDKVAAILKSFNSSDSDYNSIRDVLSTGMFFWIDQNKMLTMSSEYGLVKMPLDVSGRDYLAYTVKTPWKIFTGTPTVGAASGQYVIPAGVGVVDENNKYIGTVAVGFKVYYLIERFQKLAKRYKVDFAILDERNKILMESTDGLFSEDHELSKSLQSFSKDSDEDVVLRYSIFHPRSSYVVIRNFEKYPYSVLVSLQNGSLTSGILSQAWPHLIELLIITIFFVTILYFIRAVMKK